MTNSKMNCSDCFRANGSCPACGGKVLVDEIWRCLSCGLRGNMCNSIWFQGYGLISPSLKHVDILSRYTQCLNGTLRIGDYVLSVADNIAPCIPGQVTAISLTLNATTGSDSEKNNVHADFSVFSNLFSKKRDQEIANFYGKTLNEPCSCEQANHSEVSIYSNYLIKITDVDMKTAKEIIKSEKDAMYHALHILRNWVS